MGVYDLKMRVYLLNYPDVELEKTFKVEIIWCQVTDLDLTPVPLQAYKIFLPKI